MSLNNNDNNASSSSFLHHQVANNESYSFMLSDPAEHIKVGSFYEIDHTKLPPKCPDQLNSIRIAMVNEKTRMRVSLRFPSIFSLRAYFNESKNIKKLPSFDDKYIIGSEIAAEALYRRIPPQEITEKKSIRMFWTVPSIAAQKLIPNSASTSTSFNVSSTRKGSLWSQIKDKGMVKWGQKRQVRYLAGHINEDHHHDNKRKLVSSCKVHRKEEESEESEDHNEDEDEDEDEKQDDDVKMKKKKEEEEKEVEKNLKRKQRGYSSSETAIKNQKKTKMIKRPESENKNNNHNQIVVYKHKKHKVLKSSYDRWSAERYQLAEVNMLKIMKEQNAVFGKPILRPELRAEARRLIGDTGLLDHLLKHMAGKVAPGGEERFRRRHNAEGAMEYWLEKADLVDIRREAGVQDPYWTPPPGWNPGDNPTQDPICAREIKQLKQEIAKLHRDMEELLSKKHEEESAIVTTPISPATSPNIEHDNLMILKEMYIDLVNRRAKIDEQLLEISQSLCGMEEGMEKLKTAMEEANGNESSERLALMELTESVKHGVLGQEQIKAGGNSGSPTTKSPAPTEDKAAKIERLKSGFRICKPHGTFLWPNKGMSSPQVVVQFEDLFSVPTPPSVSSTSASQTHLVSTHSTSPPMKPLAEKRPVTINALSSSVSTPVSSPMETIHSSTQYDQNSNISTISTTSTATLTKTKNTLINLNEPPGHQNDNGLSSYPVTYQRRNYHPVTTSTSMSTLGHAKKEVNQWEANDQGKELIRCCSASSTTASCFSVGSGPWLGLASSKPDSAAKPNMV